MAAETPPADWQDDMNSRFSRLFGGRSMYAAVGDGWGPLVLDLLSAIDAAVPADEPFLVSDLKEKFGKLRCYTHGETDVEDLVDAAVERSRVTCEVCGAPGRMRGGGWYAVRCDEHAEAKP